MMERLAIVVTANGSQAMSEMDKLGSKADREFGKLEKGSEKAAAGFTAAGTKMMVGAAVVDAVLYKAGQAASELEQSVGGSEAVFKEHAKTMGDWAKTADQTVGLSEQMARSLSTRLGGALKGLGYETEDAAKQARNLTVIAADLAATYGGTTAEAVEALGSALRGEFDPAERFNLFLKQSTVDAKAVEMGLAKTTTEVSANARAQATLALVTAQSADAQGQFAREADTAAGKMQRAQAAAENSAAALGEAWLPIQNQVLGVLGKVGSGFTDLNTATNGGAANLIAYGAAATGIIGALSAATGKIMAARAATGALNVTMTGALMGWAAVAAAAMTYKAAQDEAAEATKAMGKTLKESFNADNETESIDRLSRVLKEIEGIDKAIGESPDWQFWDKDYRDQLGGAKEELWAAAQAEKALLRADRELAAQTGVSVESIREKRRETEATTGAVEKAGSSEAYVKEKTEESTKAIKAKTEALDKATSAVKSLYDEQFRGVDAQSDYESALDDTYNTLRENGLTLNVMTEEGRENAKTLRDQASAAMAYAAEIGRTEGPDAATAAMERMRAQFVLQLQTLGMTKEQATLYVNEVLKLDGKHVQTTFQTAGLNEAVANLGTFGAYLDYIATHFPEMVKGANAGVAAAAAYKPKARAMGGPVTAGEPYIVGDGGRPELFVPDQNGTIMPDLSKVGMQRTSGDAPAGGTQRVEFVLTDQNGRSLMSFLADLDGRVA